MYYIYYIYFPTIAQHFHVKFNTFQDYFRVVALIIYHRTEQNKPHVLNRNHTVQIEKSTDTL